MGSKVSDTQTGRKLTKAEVAEILERNAALWKGDESFVTYLIDLALYLLEYEYDWSLSAAPAPAQARRPAGAAWGDPRLNTVVDPPGGAKMRDSQARAREAKSGSQAKARDPRATHTKIRESQARKRGEALDPAPAPPPAAPRSAMNKAALESFLAHAENLVKGAKPPKTDAGSGPAAESSKPSVQPIAPSFGAGASGSSGSPDAPRAAVDDPARRSERQKEVHNLLKSIANTGKIKTNTGKRACPHCGAMVHDELICPMCFNLTR